MALTLMIDVRQHCPMSDHLVAKKASAKSVSTLDEYEHVFVQSVNTNLPGRKIRLELSGNPVICREPSNEEYRLNMRKIRLVVPSQGDLTHYNWDCYGLLLLFECIDDGLDGITKQRGSFFTRGYEIR